MNKLIEAYEEYQKLLSDELDELVLGASLHGWKSKRFEQGKILREKISLLKLELTTPQQTVSAEDKGVILARHFKELNELAKPFYQCLKQVGSAMEEYRNQPVKFTPERTAKEEAERLFSKLGHLAKIHVQDKIKAASVLIVWHEEVLTILKGM